MRNALRSFNPFHALQAGCWSCFPSREESAGWAVLGALFATLAIVLISVL